MLTSIICLCVLDPAGSLASTRWSAPTRSVFRWSGKCRAAGRGRRDVPTSSLKKGESTPLATPLFRNLGFYGFGVTLTRRSTRLLSTGVTGDKRRAFIGPIIRRTKHGYILTTDQSYAGHTGIFSRRTNHAQEARVYAYDGPIVLRMHAGRTLYERARAQGR
eukprot:4409190-Pyramimonas_sp.AAC.1